MHRCLQLAKMGTGNVAPNPMVGAVLVYENEIIGEGYHQQYGQAHAEVNCINNVSEANQSVIEKSTLYVSLEPCAHFGKTPPCADLIIKNKIPNVVIACRDSYEEVDGKGIQKLQQAGVNVIVGILEKEALELNKRFFTFHRKQRPYIILKWAQSKDGFIGKQTERVLISNELSQTQVHKWRSEEQAIMIGTKTALIDNPNLNVREWFGSSPVKIVIDKNLKLPPYLNIFNGVNQTLVLTTKDKSTDNNVKCLQLNENNFIVDSMLKALHEQNIQSVLVEGGAELIQSFIDEGFWDEARVITGNIFLNDGIRCPRLDLSPISNQNSLDDVIYFYQNKNAV